MENPKKDKREKPKKSRMMMAEGSIPDFIVGSKSIGSKPRPYLVSFGLQSLSDYPFPSGHVCAGTLIAPIAVLSAASEFLADEIVYHYFMM